jgi:hypothetical protein
MMATELLSLDQERETAVVSTAAPAPEPRLIRAAVETPSDWRVPLALWAVSRVLVAVALVAGSIVWPIWHDFRKVNPHAGPVADLPAYLHNYAANPASYGPSPMIGVQLAGDLSWLAPFVQWDAIWFQSVVELGYRPFPELKSQQNVAFFPGYPLAIRGATWFGLAAPLAAVLIAQLATLLASMVLYRTIHRHWGQATARWATACWLFWPASLFGSTGYSDAPMALLAALSMESLLAERYVVSGLWAGLATATRAPALAIGFSLIPAVFSRKGGWAILGGLLSVTGVLAYFTHLWSISGDPLLYPHILKNWSGDREQMFNPLLWVLMILRHGFRSLRVIVQGEPSYLLYSSHLWEPLFGGIVLVLFAGVCWLRRPGLALSSFLMIAMPLHGGGLTSFTRYSWCNLPLFVVLGLWLSGHTGRWVWMGVSTLALIWLAVMHGGGWEVI